ncbi:MAG: DUF11 domain-containing protein [Thermoleophilaceae bacterium]|nr:DUF11 domain-containing protein [Thermoleophilaceae bacterium]
MSFSSLAQSRCASFLFALSLLFAACVLVAISPAAAEGAVSCAVPTAGTPAIALNKSAPSEVLYANQIPITLTASQPASPPGAPESGFNLSFRDVLTPGVSYVPGSSSVAPQQIADQPALGYTTLIFSNVADLAPNSQFALTYKVQYDTGMFDAGDTVETGTAGPPAAAGAYVNCDPRLLPRFDSAGLPTGTPANSASSEATTGPSFTDLRAVQIEKSEPSPEGELLRGVHDNKTAYTITLKNNTIHPSDSFTVVDYLPAGLEFLGCGDVDNTTDSPTNSPSPLEYPGSGSIASGPIPGLPNGCPAPDSVEFGTFDPDGAGPAASGLYTRVSWNLGPAADLAPAAEFKFNYVAAIPICPNTTTWTGATPTAASLGQVANLDNNSCAGGETVDETALTNYATVDGTYQGGGGPVAVSDDTSHTVTAEDLAIWKESVPGDFEVGALNRWRLHVRSSEYRTFDNVVIDDTAPNGTCPVTGTSPPATPSTAPECADTGNSADNPIPSWSSASENPDGSWSVAWALGSFDHNQETLVEFSTLTREFYQSGFADSTPVLSGDSLTNNVSIVGNAYPICSDATGVIACVGPTPPYIAHTETPGNLDTDDNSVAIVNSDRPALDKQVAVPASLPQPVDCATAAGASYVDGPASPYRPGDIVCWKLRVDFLGGISTGGIVLTDFLPSGTSYATGVPGTGPTANNDVLIDPIVDNGTFIEFPVAGPDDTVNPAGHTFEYIIATAIDNVSGDPTEIFPPLRGNLLKLSTANTAGNVTTYRDQAEAEAAEPIISLTKGVDALNGDTGVAGRPDTVVVSGNDVATFHVDVANSGQIDAVNSVVQEHTPSPYDCSTLSNFANLGIADSAACVNSGGGATITWTGVDVDAGATTTLAFDFTVTDDSSPFTEIPDVACVYSFDNETNQPFPNDTFTHFPDNSLRPECTPPPGPTPTLPAFDDSKVVGGGSFVKTQSTSINETNNNLGTQATLGETVNYTVTFTLPKRMTVTNMSIVDQFPATFTLVPLSVVGQLDGGALPGGMSATSPGGVPTLTIGTYKNTTNSPQVFTLAFSVTVNDVGNNHGNTRNNVASRTFTDQFGATQSNVNSNTTTTTIVEPNPAIAKNENDGDDVVSPGQEIEYTVTLTNPNRGSGPASSPLHDTVVVDTVPAGLTPTNGAGTPIADGGTVVRCNGAAASPAGVWNDGANTITWTVGDVAPLASTPLRYCVEVDSSPAPVGGQVLTNTAALTGTSMPGVVAGERTYNRNRSDSVTVAGTATIKTVSDNTATIGQTVTYTVEVALPANTQFYDFRVVDDMPAGFDNITFGSYTCTSGCPPTPAAPTTSIGAGDILTWDFGSIAAHTSPRVLQLQYTARIDDAVGNQQGTILTNTAGPVWCSVATAPCPAPNVVTPTPDTEAVTVTEPNLTIDKDVSCQSGDADSCNVQPGSSFTYTVTIDNTGTETAYDSIIQDTVPTPSNLVNIVVGPLPAGVTAVAPGPGYSYAWQIDQLAPADAPIVITYTADLAASSNFRNLDTVANTARVTQYWGLNLADRTANPDARTYPEGALPEDTVTLTVHVPNPLVLKTVADGGYAEINQPIQWTLTISNADSVATLNDIDVTDVLPTGWEYVAGSTERDSVAYSDPAGTPVATGPTLTWTNIGDIAGGGAPIVLTFDAIPTMSALLPDGEPHDPYTNVVDIAGTDASGATSSATAPYTDEDDEDAEIILPWLPISKTPDAGTAIAGTWNDFTIVVENTGLGTARDVEISDTVPAGLTYNLTTNPETAVCSPAPCDNFALDSSSATQIDWTLDSLTPGETITITVPMFVPADTADGATFINTAAVRSTERPAALSDTGEITVETETDLAITKVGTPNPGTAGENIVYTITATNNGPSDASGVEVSDSIDLTEFDFVSAVAATPGDSCTTSGSPIDQIDCDAAGTLQPGDSREFTVTLHVRSGLVDPVSNTATVTGDQTDPVPGNNSDTEVIPLGTTADLVVTKAVSTGDPSTIINHDETAFTITVTNDGPSDALNVELVDDLPLGLSCVSTTPAASGCSAVAGADVTWTIGTVVAGETVTLNMTVRGESVGTDWTNTATGSTTTTESSTANNSDSADVTVTPMADLAIDKTASASPSVASGGDFHYTLTITNNGPDDAVTPEVTDTLPAGIAYLSHSFEVGSGTCTVAGQLLSCDLPTMAPSDNVEIRVNVNAGFDYSDATVTNTAHVESPVTPDTIQPNNTDSVDVAVGPNADVAIVKTGPSYGAAGYPLTYTLSVVNNGPATAEAVVVTDPLPAGLSYQSATPSVGSCTESGGTVTCQLGDMAINATAQIVVVAVPQDSVVGSTVTNTATAASTTPDPDLSNNSSSVNTPIENNAYPTSSNVTITKTASQSSPKVGDTVTYTMTVANSGPDTARSVVVTDTLPAGLIFKSAGGGDATSCAFVDPVVTCQLGDIAAGGSKSFTLTAVVAATGSIVNSATVTALNDRNPGDNTATSPIVAGKSTAKLSITKVANRSSVPVGGHVKFTIKVKNVSKVTAVRVEVCDKIPSRLSVVKKAGGKLVSGSLCWEIATLSPGSSRTYKPTFRVNNGRGGVVTNPVSANATNAKTVRAQARIRVPAVASRGGGTAG